MKGSSVRIWAPRLLFMMSSLLLVAADAAEEARKDIVAAYQRSLDALQRGDADAAMQIDTNDWVSVTAGQKPRTRQERAVHPAGYRQHETAAGLVSYLEARLRTEWHVIRHSDL